MAFGCVQASIHYDFVNTALLQSALIAPHRSDEEKQYYHGNRDLAKMGGHAVDMVATHNAMVEGSGVNRMSPSFLHRYTSESIGERSPAPLV